MTVRLAMAVFSLLLATMGMLIALMQGPQTGTEQKVLPYVGVGMVLAAAVIAVAAATWVPGRHRWRWRWEAHHRRSLRA